MEVTLLYPPNLFGHYKMIVQEQLEQTPDLALSGQADREDHVIRARDSSGLGRRQAGRALATPGGTDRGCRALHGD